MSTGELLPTKERETEEVVDLRTPLDACDEPDPGDAASAPGPDGAVLSADSVDGPAGSRAGFTARHRRWILLAVFVGFALRALLASMDYAPSTDETVYLRSGVNLWEGEGFTRDGHAELHFPPLVPTVVGGVAQVVDDPHSASVIVTLIAGTLAILPIAGLAGRVGGPSAAVAGAWLGALVPGLAVEIPNRGGGSEAPYLLVATTAIYLAVRVLDAGSMRNKALLAAGSGLGFGLAYLARPEGLWIGLVTLAVLAAVTIGGPIRLLREPRRALGLLPATLAVSLAFTAAMACCVYPYTGYLEEQTGTRALTAKTQDASIEAWRGVAEGRRRARDEVLYALDESGLEFSAGRSSLPQLVRDDPIGYLGIVGVNSRAALDGFAKPTDVGATLPSWRIVPIPIGLAALWAAWRHRRDRRVVLLVIAGAVPLATTLAFFFLPRYVVVATALLAVLGGVALADIVRARPSWRPAVVAVTGGLLVWSFIGQTWGDNGLLDPREAEEQRTIGEWIEANTDEDTTIMTRSQVVAYYADRPTVAMPYADYDRILGFGRHYGADLLVADQYILWGWRPQLRSLFAEGPWKDLELVHEIRNDGRLVRVFDLGEGEDFEGDLPRLAHAGDGSPSARPEDG